MEPETSIRSCFASAQAHRKSLENSPDTTTTQYQENLQAAIASLRECRNLADRISLFSPNETEDDIATLDLQYTSCAGIIHERPLSMHQIHPHRLLSCRIDFERLRLK